MGVNVFSFFWGVFEMFSKIPRNFVHVGPWVAQLDQPAELAIDPPLAPGSLLTHAQQGIAKRDDQKETRNHSNKLAEHGKPPENPRISKIPRKQ